MQTKENHKELQSNPYAILNEDNDSEHEADSKNDKYNITIKVNDK